LPDSGPGSVKSMKLLIPCRIPARARLGNESAGEGRVAATFALSSRLNPGLGHTHEAEIGA